MEKLFKQIGDEVTEYTAADHAQAEVDRIENERIAAELKAKIDAKESAKTELLSKLGITAEEAALLLG